MYFEVRIEKEKKDCRRCWRSTFLFPFCVCVFFFGFSFLWFLPSADRRVNFSLSFHLCSLPPLVLTACAFFSRDMLTLRFRLAFLNSQAAISVAPKVCDLMSVQLGWDEKEKKKQMEDCMSMLHEFGGPVPNKDGAQLSSTTVVDIHSMFKALDVDKNGYIDFVEFQEGAKSLGFPFENAQKAKDAFAFVDSVGDGRVDENDFIKWWTIEGMLLLLLLLYFLVLVMLLF